MSCVEWNDILRLQLKAQLATPDKVNEIKIKLADLLIEYIATTGGVEPESNLKHNPDTKKKWRELKNKKEIIELYIKDAHCTKADLIRKRVPQGHSKIVEIDSKISELELMLRKIQGKLVEIQIS